MTPTDQILNILHRHPFSRFYMSQLKPILQPTTLSEAEIDDAMLEQ